VNMRRVLFNVPLLLLFAPGGYAQTAWTWDGTWTGSLQNRAGLSSPISITIANDKVVSFLLRGAVFDVQYTKMTSDGVSFGDRDNYSVRLERTDNRISATLRGRNGSEMALLARR